PLGVLLSGGLDSSIVTALMAAAGSGRVQTFSIGFAQDPGSNELADARRVADPLRTDHHELLMGGRDDPEPIEDGLWHLEEPIVDLSFLGMLLLSRLVREHVTVALSGQGADELLAGYRKHQVTWAADRLSPIPAPIRRSLSRAVGGRRSGAFPRTVR